MRSKESVAEIDSEDGKEVVSEKGCNNERTSVTEVDPKDAAIHDDQSFVTVAVMKDPKWSVPHSEVLSADIQCLEKNSKTELDNLSPPCFIEFKCRLLCDSDEEPSKKRRKLSSGRQTKKNKLSSPKELTTVLSEDTSSRMFIIEFEWLGGEERDLLHQIVQFFVNKFQQQKCTV